MIRTLLTAICALHIAAPAAAQPRQAELDSLLAADRAFSAAAASAPTAADGVIAMLDAQAMMPAPDGLAIGRDAVAAAFRASPAWQSGTASWAPIRGGVSADGTQGFTYGFLSVTAGPAERRDRKYLAYWVRRTEGWRVVAYRQNPRQPGEVSAAMLAPSLPGRAVAPGTNAAPHQASLATAEQAFSDRAQQVGLRRAFREYGAPDAMNMYAGAGFTIGVEAVSQGVAGEETTSPVRWSTEHSFVASSGDLGVSIGTIRTNAAPTDGRPAAFPFFTVWRRDAPDAPWRYIAE